MTTIQSVATIEILSDSETMRNIADTLQEIERGNLGTSWEKIKKDLKLNV